ncbi:DUF4209 domain-containing protein [Streptomyces mirabilis]|uniref:DUF4209 domain-containing protein n=1 Tax=Streptomyces mirabilis TaxID=68239 RepID=UPI0033A674D2
MVPQGDQVENVASAIDQAAQESSKFDAGQALRVALLSSTPTDFPVNEIPDLSVKAALWAFEYHISVKSENNRLRAVIEPRFRGASGESEPPEVADVPDEVAQIWNALVAKVTSSWGQARLHHLLFERRFGNPHQHAVASAESYLSAAKDWEIGLDRAQYLGIALRVAKAVNSADLANSVVSQLVDDATQELSRDEVRPGVFMRLVEPILAERRLPTVIDDLLESATLKYSDPFIQDEILGLQIGKASDVATKRVLRERRVRVWGEAADRAQGIVRAMHLKKALERAEESQERDLVERAAARLQELRNEDLGLVTFTASTNIDAAEIERLLAPMRDVGNWQHALLCIFQAYGPSTGNLTQNQTRVGEHVRQFVFSAMVSSELLGGDGLPRYHPQSEEDRSAMALAEQESHNIQAWAPILAMALSRIAEIYGIPDEKELAEFFSQAPLADDSLAHALARSFIRYWAGDVEGAAFTILPRIEALTRNLVVAMDRGVYRLQRDRKPGQYPGLGYLLDVLKEHGMDESWHRCVLTVCANPAGGWNIRNEVAHGFIDDMTAPAAAVVLQVAIYLWSLNGRPDDASNAGEAQ